MKRAKKYVFTLETKLEEARVFKKIDKLEMEIKAWIKEKKGSKDALIRR